MKALRFVLLGIVLQSSWMFVAAAAARDAASFGGNGGGEFHAKCPAHYALFAYTGRAGKALDRIRPLCVEIRADKAVGAGQKQAGDAGGNGGEAIRRTCPSNSVVTWIRVWSGRDNLVSLIDLQCINLQTNEQPKAVPGRTEGKPGRQDISTCNPDEIAVGMHGRYGAMVDRLGLICEKRSVVIPKQVSDKPVKLRDGDQKRTATLSPIATFYGSQKRLFDDQPIIGTFTRHGTKCVPYAEFPGVLKGMVGWGQGEAGTDACISYILQLGVDFDLSAFAQNTQITRAILTYDEGPAPLCPLVVGEQNTCWQSGGGRPQDKPNGCVVVRIPSVDWRRKGPNGLMPVLPDGQPATQQITARKWDVTSALFRHLSPPLGGNPGFGFLLAGGPRSVKELDAMDKTICTSKVTNIRLIVDYIVSTKDAFVQPR